jgi:methylglyoxal synthase
LTSMLPEKIGILANRSMRSGPNSPLIRFVREFEPYFREAGVHIYALEGTYRAILRNGLLHDHEDLYALPAGYAGGMVSLTAMVVKKDEHPSLLNTVIYLIDPRDPTSVYPESLALKRECVVAGTTFLPTYSGAREWATLRWCIHSKARDRDFVQSCLASTILDAPDLLPEDFPMWRQTVALVAHDEKKREMFRFAKEHIDLLLRFDRRMATGTTGKMLNGKIVPERLPRESMKADLLAAFDSLCEVLEKRKITDWVHPEPSGPRGGDVQIAEAVLTKKCQKIIFFEDPHVSRPHEADIQLLERTSRIPGQDIMCLHDYDSAVRWASDLEECIKLGTPEPLTLIRAFRLAFGVELVLANIGTGEVSREDLWKEILLKGAWYTVSLASEFAWEKAKKNDEAYVAVTWGYSMHEMASAVERVPALLAGQGSIVDKKRSNQGLQSLEPRLGEERFLKPGNLRVLPMVGIMGTTDPRVEANKNAERLARLLGGMPQFLPDCAFTDLAAASNPGEASLGWDKVDIAIFTCDKVKDHFGQRATAPMPTLLYQQMMNAHAAGEVGGLFLNRAGEEIQPRDYHRIGMQHSQLRDVARRGGAVLVAGVEERRLLPVLSALHGKLVSAIITDIDFALDVLKLHLSIHTT